MTTGIYLSVLFESAWNASIVPFGSDTSFYAMQSFGSYDMTLATALAVGGGVIGQSFNWGLGRLMLMAKERGANVMRAETYEKAQRFFNRYLFFILLLAWLPLLKFTVLAAGFFRVPFKIALPLVAIGYIAHYAFLA